MELKRKSQNDSIGRRIDEYLFMDIIRKSSFLTSTYSSRLQPNTTGRPTMGVFPTRRGLFGLGGRDGGRLCTPLVLVEKSSPRARFRDECLACSLDIRLLSSKYCLNFCKVIACYRGGL